MPPKIRELIRPTLQIIGVTVLVISIFASGAYWGSYQFAKIFSELNIQSYFEKTYIQQLSMMGAMRELDSGNIEFARSTLKGNEDSMIVSIDVQLDYFDDLSFQRACSVMQDIYRYRQANSSLYEQRPSPIDPDINKILQKWSVLDCTTRNQ